MKRGHRLDACIAIADHRRPFCIYFRPVSSSIQLRKIAFETITSIFDRRIRTLFPSIKLERRSHKIIEDPVRGQRERKRIFFFVIDRFQIRFLAALNSLLHSSNLLSRRFSIHVIFLVRCLLPCAPARRSVFAGFRAEAGPRIEFRPSRDKVSGEICVSAVATNFFRK